MFHFSPVRRWCYLPIHNGIPRAVASNTYPHLPSLERYQDRYDDSQSSIRPAPCKRPNKESIYFFGGRPTNLLRRTWYKFYVESTTFISPPSRRIRSGAPRRLPPNPSARQYPVCRPRARWFDLNAHLHRTRRPRSIRPLRYLRRHPTRTSGGPSNAEDRHNERTDRKGSHIFGSAYDRKHHPCRHQPATFPQVLRPYERATQFNAHPRLTERRPTAIAKESPRPGSTYDHEYRHISSQESLIDQIV